MTLTLQKDDVCQTFPPLSPCIRCVQYHNGYHEYREGCSVLWGISWVPWGCSVPWWIPWVPWWVILTTMGDTQYRGEISWCKNLLLFEYPTVLNIPHGTHDIPHMHHGIPKELKLQRVVSPTVLNPPPPPPPRYSWYPPHHYDISHGTKYLHSTQVSSQYSWYPPRYWTPHSTQDILHIYHNIPTVLNILHNTHDIPPRYSWYPPWYWTPPRYWTHVIQGGFI